MSIDTSTTPPTSFDFARCYFRRNGLTIVRLNGNGREASAKIANAQEIWPELLRIHQEILGNSKLLTACNPKLQRSERGWQASVILLWGETKSQLSTMGTGSSNHKCDAAFKAFGNAIDRMRDAYTRENRQQFVIG